MTDYDKQLAKIDSTHIGFEDHGILSWNIDFDLGGSHQGTGHRFLNNEYAGPMLEAVLNAVGCDTWERLVGHTVFVLRKEGEPFGMIRGIEKLPTEKRGGRVVFDEVAAEVDAVRS